MYLLRKKNYRKLRKNLEKIAKRNKTKIDQDSEYSSLRQTIMESPSTNTEFIPSNNPSITQKNSLTKKPKKEKIEKKKLGLFQWLIADKKNAYYQFSLAMQIISNYSVYYGLTQSIQDLGLRNIQFNGIILALTLMAGYLFTAKQGPKLPRVKWAKISIFVKIFAAFLLAGLSLWKYSENRYSLIAESFVSTFGLGTITGIQSYVIYSMNAELVPTEIRGKSIALTLLIGNLSGTLTPYLANMSMKLGLHVMVGCSLSSFIALPFVYGVEETIGHTMMI